MLRRLAPILTIISFVFVSLFFAPKIYAVDPSPTQAPSSKSIDGLTQQSGLEGYLQEYCAKRQGNQMNLETWYSGKCTNDTFSGEGVGFADMVILDLAEKVSGKNDPTKTFSQTFKEFTNQFKDSSDQGMIIDARQKFFASQSNGLVGQTGSLIGMLYQYQPASTKSYLAYVNSNLQKHKVIPQALALTTETTNGAGFDAFSPFLPLWMAVRNLAYIGLVAFFIIYGFMMMFRINLGQKTVITVQLAIPKLIVTLLIITFSYAIVGLVFDLMYVVIYFIFSYLGSQDLINNGPKWNPAKAASGFGYIGLAGSMIINALVAVPASTLGVINLVLGGLSTAAGAAVMIGLPGITMIVAIIIAIAVIISYGKLFVKLIGSFISIVISLITAPLVLLGNAFPGSQAIGNWFRGLVGNVSVFPATIILLMLSYMFMIQPVVGLCTDTSSDIAAFFSDGTVNNGSIQWCEDFFGVKSLASNPLEGSSQITGVPLISPIGGFNARNLLALLGVGLLLMASKYVDMIKDLFKVPPFKYGSAIEEALKMGISTNASWAKGGYQLAPDRLKTATTDKASAWMQAKAGDKSQKIQEASEKIKL